MTQAQLATKYQFTFNVRRTFGASNVPVLAQATVSPWFVVTPTVDPCERGYCVTHVPTGLRALGPFRTARAARLCAAVLEATGIPWGAIEADGSNANRINQHYAPPWFDQWRKLF